MNMQLAGLLFELLLFGAGLYIYLFSIGGMKTNNPTLQKKGEEFRRENHRTLRLVALALMAIMFVNIFLSLKELLG